MLETVSSCVIFANSEEDFSAEKFVEELLTDGSKRACDDSENAFITQNSVPNFYDENLYKRGQGFYHEHIFAFFFGKLNGLLAVLAIPTTLKILQHTRMSSSDFTAYRRYMATIFHMIIWYDDDFKPGTKLWQSVCEVKKLHNSASNRSCMAGLHRISQKDMALTQFGFMGFPLIRSEMVGIHGTKDKDFEGIIHLWRVVGHVMGIEERFNICRESVQETKEICRVLLERVFRPQIEGKDKDFLEMSGYLVNGLWCMSPFLMYKSIMCYLYCLVANRTHNDKEIPSYLELNKAERVRLNLLYVFANALKYRIVRVALNLLMYMTFFLMKYCPFLAYYRFGFKMAHVTIPVEDNLKYW